MFYQQSSAAFPSHKNAPVKILQICITKYFKFSVIHIDSSLNVKCLEREVEKLPSFNSVWWMLQNKLEVLFFSDNLPTLSNQCPVCFKIFLNRAHVRRHMPVHTGEKPFPCKLCVKRFKQRCHLKSHMATCHNLYEWSVCFFCFL